MKNNKSMKKIDKAFIGVIGVFVILVITVNILTNGYEKKENESLARLETNTKTYNTTKDYSSNTCKYTDIELKVYAKHLVEQELKNPKSADFSNVEVVKASDEILVTGKVEATNSFDAIVSNGFIVTFEADGTATGEVAFTE